MGLCACARRVWVRHLEQEARRLRQEAQPVAPVVSRLVGALAAGGAGAGAGSRGG